VYLDDRNTKSCGFQPIAIAHSLPKALFVWGLLLFAVQGFWVAFAGLSPLLLLSTLFPIAAVLVVVCACIWKALHPRQKPFEGPMLSTPTPPPFPAEQQKEHHTVEAMV
jgi:choline-glycine betaine transporter